MARELKAVSIRIIATSAARDALNPEELISALEAASGLKVEIISGEKEAEWAFQGVTTDPELARQPLLPPPTSSRDRKSTRLTPVT